MKGYISLLKERKTAPATLHKIVAAVKNFLHYAYRQGLTDGDISKDIEEEIRLPKIGHQPVKTLQPRRGREAFYPARPPKLKGRRDMVILSLASYRLFAARRWRRDRGRHIHASSIGRSFCINGKGIRYVEAPLREDVYAAIESYLRYRPRIDSNRLLVTAKKPYQPMSPKTIWKLMETLGKKIGIRADVHSMRRAALSYTALEGLNEKGEAGGVLITQTLARHEHASTTFRYIKDASQAKDPAVLHNPLGRTSERKEAPKCNTRRRH